jgi:hypothetical protein
MKVSACRFQPLAIALIVSDGQGGQCMVSSQQLDMARVEIHVPTRWDGPFIGNPYEHAVVTGPTTVAIRVEGRAATVYQSMPTAVAHQLPSGIYLPDFAYAAQPPLLLPAPRDE